MEWKNVYVFISSTFNDMHAERDYLIKNVFPELSSWCEKYRLRLIDIDLRWGITENDATKNNRVVDLCMQGIDKCHPFFLCFLGQRRGWIPTQDELSSDTLDKWPDLKPLIGELSITELEIFHSLFKQKEETNNNNCLFLFRDPSYIKDIICEETKEIYEPSDPETKEKFNAFKAQLRKTHQEQSVEYSATWNSDANSPEQYKKEYSEEKNMRIQKGRLTDFMINSTSMKQYLLNYFKERICSEYPEHFNEKNQNLSQEDELQNKFLARISDGYVESCDGKNIISEFFEDAEKRILLIVSAEGAGKTSLAASIVKARQSKEKVIYRFVAASNNLASVCDLFRSILIESAQNGVLDYDTIPNDDKYIKSFFLSTLKNAEFEENYTIIVDGIDNLSGYNGIDWLNSKLPLNIKFVFTLSESESNKISMLSDGNVVVKTLGTLNSETQKKLTEESLSKYLKRLDTVQLDELLNLEGAGNPLFLKVVLSELRVFGSFELLLDKIKSSFGVTPVTAFEGMLGRLEEDSSHALPNSISVPLFFGLIACSSSGLSFDELAEMIYVHTDKKYSLNVVKEELSVIFYQVKDFLLTKNGRISFQHRSFKQAAENLYGNQFENYRKRILEYNQNIISENSASAFAYRELLYQTNMLNNNKSLIEILGDFDWLYRIIVFCGPEMYLKAIKWLPANIIPRHLLALGNVVTTNFNLIDENRNSCLQILVDCLYNEENEHIRKQINAYLKNSGSVNFIPSASNKQYAENTDCLFRYDNFNTTMHGIEQVVKYDKWWMLFEYDGTVLQADAENPSEFDVYRLENFPENQIVNFSVVYKDYFVANISDKLICFYSLKTKNLEKRIETLSYDFEIFGDVLWSFSEHKTKIEAFDIESSERLYSIQVPYHSALTYFSCGEEIHVNVRKVRIPFTRNKCLKKEKGAISLSYGYYVISLRSGEILSKDKATLGIVRTAVGQDYYIDSREDEDKNLIYAVCDLNDRELFFLDHPNIRCIDKAFLCGNYIVARSPSMFSAAFYVFEFKSGKLISSFQVDAETKIRDGIVTVSSYRSRYVQVYSYEQFIEAYKNTACLSSTGQLSDIIVTPSLAMKRTAWTDKMAVILAESLLKMTDFSFVKESVRSLNPVYSIKKFAEIFRDVKESMAMENITVEKTENGKSKTVFKKNIGLKNVKSTFTNDGIVLLFDNKHSFNKLVFINNDGIITNKYTASNITEFFNGEELLAGIAGKKKIFIFDQKKIAKIIKTKYSIDASYALANDVTVYSNRGKLLVYAVSGDLLFENDVDKDLSPKIVAYGYKVFMATEDGRLIMHVLDGYKDYVISENCFITRMINFRHYLVYSEHNRVHFYDIILRRHVAELVLKSEISHIFVFDNKLIAVSELGELLEYKLDFSAIKNRIEEYCTLPEMSRNLPDVARLLEQLMQTEDSELIHKFYEEAVSYIEADTELECNEETIPALDTVLSLASLDEELDVSELILKISELSLEYIRNTDDAKIHKSLLEINKRIYAEVYDDVFNIGTDDHSEQFRYYAQLKLNIIKMMEADISEDEMRYSEIKLYNVIYEYAELVFLLSENEEKQIYKEKAISLCETVYSFSQDEYYLEKIDYLKSL